MRAPILSSLTLLLLVGPLLSVAEARFTQPGGASAPLSVVLRAEPQAARFARARIVLQVKTSRLATVSLVLMTRPCGAGPSAQVAASPATELVRGSTRIVLGLRATARRALALGEIELVLRAHVRAVAVPRAARSLRLAIPSPLSCGFRGAGQRFNRYRGRVGIGAHMLRGREPDVQQQLRRLRRGGVDWIREDFSWLQIEPARGVFDWSASDHFMAAAAVEDISVLAIADYSAPWASSDPTGKGDQLFPPRNVQDFADYTQALARRYGVGGRFWQLNPALPVKPLAAIELWNEPYGYWFWKTGPNPAAYAKLVEAASAAIREVDPRITLLASGDLVAVYGDDSKTQWRDWLTALLAVDPAIVKAIDAWSVHPYPSPWNLGPYGRSWSERLSFDRVARIHDILQARAANKPIWITEIGWTTATAVSGGVSEQTQSRYLVSAVKRAVDDWGAFVPHIFLFSWDKASGIPTDRDTNNGLRRPDDSARPGWIALKALLAPAAER